MYDDVKEHSDIGELSDASNLSSPTTPEIDTTRSPPSRGNLERESTKLRSKFKILKQALDEEKVAGINRNIDDLEKGDHPEVKEELNEATKRKTERMAAAHEKKRAKMGTVINDYQATVQSIKDEGKVKPIGLAKV